MMALRNKLEELGKMKGVNQDEKGIILFNVIATFYDRNVLLYQQIQKSS